MDDLARKIASAYLQEMAAEAKNLAALLARETYVTDVKVFASGYFGVTFMVGGEKFWALDMPGVVGSENQRSSYVGLWRDDSKHGFDRSRSLFYAEHVARAFGDVDLTPAERARAHQAILTKVRALVGSSRVAQAKTALTYSVGDVVTLYHAVSGDGGMPWKVGTKLVVKGWDQTEGNDVSAAALWLTLENPMTGGVARLPEWALKPGGKSPGIKEAIDVAMSFVESALKKAGLLGGGKRYPAYVRGGRMLAWRQAPGPDMASVLDALAAHPRISVRSQGRLSVRMDLGRVQIDIVGSAQDIGGFLATVTLDPI